MLERVIAGSIRHRGAVVLAAAVVLAFGVHALFRTPIDAIPDLSENQVIVATDWMGRSPREVDEQVTQPLSIQLRGIAGVKAVRASSELGFSLVHVVFEETVNSETARARVAEGLRGAALPPEARAALGPDATALGQVFWYTLEGDLDLGAMRAVQDGYVARQLAAVPGVAEVAPIGGFVREYHIEVDPLRLRQHGIGLHEVVAAASQATGATGGEVIQDDAGAEHLVRAVGWLRSADELGSTVVGWSGPAAHAGGAPIRIRDVATVQLGPRPRRGVLERDGREVVGAVVLARPGENPLELTRRLEARIAELAPGLPPGVRVVPFYTRTRLIEGAIATIARTLVEEIAIAALAVLLVLGHARSALVVCLSLPFAVLAAFGAMRLAGLPANIMSLAGIAISVGVLVDASIVMVENATTALRARFGERVGGDTREVLAQACATVGRPIFASILIVLVSFLPVLALGGTEGKMFRPLALSKTFAIAAVAVFSVTVVPALLPTFLRGRLRGEGESWIVRSIRDVYRPVLSLLLPRPGLCLALLVGLVLVGFALSGRLGREFVPALDEGTLLEMPVTVPRISLGRAAEDLRARDALLRAFPEVESVVGKAGRAETASDPAPPDMIETIVNLKPRSRWPRRVLEDVNVDAAAVASFDFAARVLLVERDREARLEAARAVAQGIAHDVVESLHDRRLLLRTPHQGDLAVLTSVLVADHGAVLAVRSPAEEIAAAARTTARVVAHVGLASAKADLLALSLDRLATRADERRAASLEASLARAEAELLERAPPGRSLRRRTREELLRELDAALDMPGWANIWTQPIVNRIDMLATGIRAQVGVKVQGPDLVTLQDLARRIATVLEGVPGAADVFADQIVGESYLEVHVDRARASAAGVTPMAVLEAVEVALAGKVTGYNLEGTLRVPIRVRYGRDQRSLESVRKILAHGRAGAVPLAEVASVELADGPSMIKSEDGILTAYVQLNVRGRDVVGFVEEARRAVAGAVVVPRGYALAWSGEFEAEVRARRTLQVVIPLVGAVILLVLWLTYGSLGEALLVMLAVPGALAGGVLFQWLWGVPWSVPVWVGYVACFGLATETGVIMLIYLREAVARRGPLSGLTAAAVREAVLEGAVQRLRPKILTEATIVLGLIPMLWATGPGAEVTRPMAIPVLGGILVADEVIDVFLPVFYAWLLERRRAR